MKIKFFATIAAISLVALAGTRFSKAQTDTKATTKEVMNMKLDYSHYILNAVATGNFSLMSENAEKLSQLTQLSAWSGHKTTEYEVLSAEFRKHADALAKAAKERNLDAASLAYVQMTLSCVNCHKYMRAGNKTGEL